MAGRRRRGRRLQLVLGRSRRSRAAHRRPGAQLDHHRSAQRPHPGLHRGSARAHGEGRRDPQGAGQRVRSSRAAPARRAVHHVVRQQRRAADAAELLLQQQLQHRAEQGHGDDPHRDGARRAGRANGRHASAVGAAEMVWRLDRPMGRRHARDRDHQLPSEPRLPRLVGKPEGHRAADAQGRQNARLPVHRRGSDDVHGAVHG